MDIAGRGPLQFEGRDLPISAKHFDATPFYSSLSDESAAWILDLRYAWGRARMAPSGIVLRACDEIERRIYAERDAVFAHLRTNYKDDNPAETCQEWLTAIQFMRDCAESRDACEWIVKPVEGEVAHMLEQTIGIVRHFERENYEELLPLDFEEQIKEAPEQKQLRFILEMQDFWNDTARKRNE